MNVRPVAEAHVVIEPLVVPRSLDDPDALPFLAMVRLDNEVSRHDTGHSDLDQDPTEALGLWQADADWLHVGLVARSNGAIIGAVTMLFSREPDATSAEFDLMVDPARWGEGVEDALLGAACVEARRRGRTVVQTWTLHRPDAPGRSIEPATGHGRIPADDRQTVLLTDAGFSLEQVERTSSFDLTGSFDRVEKLLAAARERMGEGYRVVAWSTPTPERYLDSFAHAISRMPTDAPAGGMVVEEETWDADRVRRRDERLAAQHLFVSLVAVEHIASGEIVAFNELVIGDDRTAATQQYGTLVLREHRGRRLGTVVKCENLLRWRTLVPQSSRVATFNAEENRHMLDINEAIGFVPISYAGAWKKVLEAGD